MSIVDVARNFAETGGLLTGAADDPRYPAADPLISSVGHALMDAPFDSMLVSIGEGIANAQFEMDLGAVKIAQLMAGMEVEGITLGNEGRFDFGRAPGSPASGTSVTLLELGFQPTFYELRQATIEFQMTVSINQETLDSRSAKEFFGEGSMASAAPWAQLVGWGPDQCAAAKVSMVNEETSSKYGFDAEGSSRLKARLRPRPAPAQLGERIRAIIEHRKMKRHRLPDLVGMKLADAVSALNEVEIPASLADNIERPTGSAYYLTEIVGYVVHDADGTPVTVDPGARVDVDAGHEVVITGLSAE